MELTLFGLAIAPGMAISIYVYFRDKYEKEPLSLLLKAFFAGFLAVIPAAALEMLFFNFETSAEPGILLIALHNFIFIGLTEELVKFSALYWIAYRKEEFNEPFDGIVYAVMVAMGFATSENITYVMNGGLTVAVIRIFTAVPAHATFGILMGYFVGLAKFRNHHKPYLVIGVGTAILFHGSYDFFLSIDGIEFIALGALVSLIIGIRLSFRAMKILSEHSPFRYSKLFLRQQPIEPQ